jgi:hypothetical protein
MQSPKLFDRGLNQLIEDGQALAQLYTPEWTAFADRQDAGHGLIELAARLVELLAERVNRVPEKNLLAFLDLVGVERGAGVPAEAPVTFLLSNRSEEGALVPAGTQVATTQTESANAQVFETRDQFFATPARLVSAINLLPASDQYAVVPPLPLPPKPADLQSAAGIEILSPEASGLSAVEHALYLASATLFARKEAADIRLEFTVANSTRAVFSSAFLAWQRFDSETKQWTDIANVAYGQSGTDRVAVTFSALPGTGKSSIAGDEDAWIVCRLKTAPSDAPALPRIGGLVGFVATALAPTTFPVALVFNATPLDGSKPVFPFGERPRYGDAFYIASDKAFAPDIETATVHITLRPYTTADLQAIFASVVANTTITTRIAWQYLAAGGEWKTIQSFTHVLEVTAPTAANNQPTFRQLGATQQPATTAEKNATLFGTIGGSAVVDFTFAPPADAAAGEVGGVSSHWLRAVLLSQAPYGRDGFVRLNTNNTLTVVGPTFIPPIIETIAIDYQYSASPVALDRITTSNNFEIVKLQPPFFDQGKTFFPFIPLGDYAPGDATGFLGGSSAIYLSFDRAFGTAFISLLMLFLEPQGSADLVPETGNPQVVWEYLTAGKAWRPLDIQDGTADLTSSGIVGFLAPTDTVAEALFSQLTGGAPLYWYRARLQSGTYATVPRLKAVVLNTVMADNQQTLHDDWVLASGSGEPDQRATILRRPVLAGDIWIRENELPSEAERDALLQELTQLAIEEGAEMPDLADAIEPRPLPDGDREIWVRWLRVPNFRASGPRSRHYTLEAVTGQVTFGNGRDAGLTPPIGKDNIVVRGLRAGGGEQANVDAVPLAIKELKTSLPFIDKVFNLSGAVGGADPWTLDQISELGPQAIKNRRRAVSTEDFESITLETFSQIARAKCLATRAPANGKPVFKPGAVSVIVMPKGTERMPQPSKALLRRIEEFLRRHALGAIASDIHALPPVYLPVAIAAKVHTAKPQDASLVERRVVQALDTFFHPLFGGEHGDGWPFGRSVYISEVFAVIERVQGVDHVVEATFVDQPALSRMDVDENVLVASGTHQIAIV